MKFGCKNCSHCGVCCEGWDIELSKEDIRNLVGLGHELDKFLDLKPVPKMKAVGKYKRCTFLDDRNMCVLEMKHGRNAKPHTCKQYPDIKPENVKENDYFFYEYGGRTFTRDLFVKILGSLGKTRKEYLFEMLLDELEIMKRQEKRYVDSFNHDNAKRTYGIGKALARRKMKGIMSRKFMEDDMKGFGKIKKSKEFEVKEMIREIQKRIPGNDAINPNLPEMLLAYFMVVQGSEPRDPKALAQYFFEWNAKRF